MKRRNLLRGALAAGLTAPALTALTAARTDIVQTLSPDAPQNLADLVGDFTALRPLLTVPQPAPVRTRLCHTAGQMAGMTAIVLHDLGSRRESRAWFATAARVAIESGDDQLHAWVLAREAMVPLNYRDEVRSVAFSADGRLLASAGGGDERVILWDTTSPDHPVERADWQAHSTTALSVAFNPRTGVLATSGGGDRPVKLWRVAGTRQPVLLAALDGPTDVVDSVGFSPDGRLLTAGSDDRTARIWRVPPDGRPRREAVLTGFTTAVLGVRFTPDGKQVVTGVFDGTAHTLSADFGRAIAHACSYAGRPLTHEQWRRYLSKVPYRRPC